MTDRCAVLTTVNGKIIEWKMFENKMRGMEYYSAGVAKLSEIITHTGDAKWEVLFCDVSQFARSFPETEADIMPEMGLNSLLEEEY